MAGRQERRRKQLLHDVKVTRGYWKLTEEALDSTLENLLWKRPWVCPKTNYGIIINIMMMMICCR
jgi:hypothetical protein